MEKKDALLAVSAGVIVYLGVKLAATERRLEIRTSQRAKLYAWGTVAQKILANIAENHPEVIEEITPEIEMEIDFYDIMSKSDML